MVFRRESGLICGLLPVSGPMQNLGENVYNRKA